MHADHTCVQTTAGGMALLYYASQRIDVRRKEVLQGAVKEGPARGIKIRAKVVKNKVAPPHGQALFDLYFDSGLDRTASMIDGAVQYGVMSKRASFYYLSEEVTGDPDADQKSFAQVRRSARSDAARSPQPAARFCLLPLFWTLLHVFYSVDFRWTYTLSCARVWKAS